MNTAVESTSSAVGDTVFNSERGNLSAGGADLSENEPLGSHILLHQLPKIGKKGLVVRSACVRGRPIKPEDLLIAARPRYSINAIIARTTKIITNHLAIAMLIPATPLAPTRAAIRASTKKAIASERNPPPNWSGWITMLSYIACTSALLVDMAATCSTTHTRT